MHTTPSSSSDLVEQESVIRELEQWNRTGDCFTRPYMRTVLVLERIVDKLRQQKNGF